MILFYISIILLLLFNINGTKNDSILFPIIMEDIIIELRDGPIVIRKDISKVAKFINTSRIPCENKGRFEMKLQSLNDPIIELGCSKLSISSSISSIESSIIIIQRGKCSLHSKAMRVMDANAKAMIIVNDNDEMFHAEFDSSEKSINEIKEEKICYNKFINNYEELKLCLDEVKVKYLLQLIVVMIPKSIGLIYKKLLNEYSNIMVRLYDKDCKERIDYTDYFTKMKLLLNNNNIINQNNNINNINSNNDNNMNNNDNNNNNNNNNNDNNNNDNNNTDNNNNENHDMEENNYFDEVCSLLQMKLEYRSMKRLLDVGIHKYPHSFTDIVDIDTILYNDKDAIVNKLCKPIAKDKGQQNDEL